MSSGRTSPACICATQEGDHIGRRGPEGAPAEHGGAPFPGHHVVCHVAAVVLQNAHQRFQVGDGLEWRARGNGIAHLEIDALLFLPRRQLGAHQCLQCVGVLHHQPPGPVASAAVESGAHSAVGRVALHETVVDG